MPRPTQSDDQSIAKDEELRLLDLLYGELDDTEAEQARREVDADEELAGELDGLARMRSLFASLPDEEPPQAISAKLLQAAAAHAPKAPAKAQHGEGFWAWFSGLFKPIVAYPGLAAVASLVLVVGIAGTLYVAGKGRTTEPKREQAPKGDTAGEEVRTWDEKETRSKQADAPGRYADLAEETETQVEVDETADDTAVKKTEAPAKNKTPKSKPADTGREGEGDQQRGGTDRNSGDGVSVTSESTLDLGGSAGEADADKSPIEANKPSMDPAPPAEPKTDSISVDVPPPDIKTLPKDEERSEARDLHDKAKSAAKRGDCTATNHYGDKIRSIDVGYYNDVYLRDATVRKCAATQDSQSTKK